VKTTRSILTKQRGKGEGGEVATKEGFIVSLMKKEITAVLWRKNHLDKAKGNSPWRKDQEENGSPGIIRPHGLLGVRVRCISHLWSPSLGEEFRRGKGQCPYLCHRKKQ